ncbi:hypothetical protein SBA4_190037 [Candidatus Sulfopaludibacter sp. SbA4]|nr:hypothetical protein SBA4_190037 [Candidatus Sulfopaludibacter sp. SbA4]
MGRFAAGPAGVCAEAQTNGSLEDFGVFARLVICGLKTQTQNRGAAHETSGCLDCFAQGRENCLCARRESWSRDRGSRNSRRFEKCVTTRLWLYLTAWPGRVRNW